MNYLRELLAFHAACLVSPVSARAMALWYTLMYFSNMARWRFPITISEAQLRGAAGGLNHEQFIKARRELVDGGYLHHFPQPGNRAAKYTMTELSRGEEMHGASKV